MFKKTAKQSLAIKLLISEAMHILLYGGSRSAKTFILCYALFVRALKCKSRHVIFRKQFNTVKTSIGLETIPKLRALCFPGIPIKEHRDNWYLEFPNGSEIWLAGLDQKDRTEKVLGKEYSTILFNEASEIDFDSAQMALTRLAENSGLTLKAYYDENPPSRKHWTHLQFIEHLDPQTKAEQARPHLYAYLQMNPMDNAANLPPTYIRDVLDNLPEPKRKRFRDGEFGDDAEGALWDIGMISVHRLPNIEDARFPEMVRIVVGVDPAVSSGSSANEEGIITVGKGTNGELYVLEDSSLVGTPLQRANAGIGAYRKWSADRVVGEVNNGGDLVEANLRNVDPNVSYESVHASRGKQIRAEPVVSLYERGLVHHVGEFPDLEDEMCTWIPGVSSWSPNRLDACFIAGTMITTDQGQRPIEALASGDMVLTRQGYRRIVAAKMRPDQHICHMKTLFGRTLYATPEHRIYIDALGWMSLDHLSPSDTLVCVDTDDTQRWHNALSVVGSSCKRNIGTGPKLVADYVEWVYDARGRQNVYNIQVEDVPEYFANGILVHNCVWAITQLAGISVVTPTVSSISQTQPMAEGVLNGIDNEIDKAYEALSPHEKIEANRLMQEEANL